MQNKTLLQPPEQSKLCPISYIHRFESEKNWATVVQDQQMTYIGLHT